MDNANTVLHDKIVDRAAVVRLYERRLHGQVDDVFGNHKERLDKLVRDSSRASLKTQLDKEFLKVSQEAYRASRNSLRSFASDQASFAYQNIEAVMGRVWKTKSRRISEDMVLSNKLLGNKTLEAGWKGLTLGERKKVDQLIRKGISEGLSMPEIAKNIRKGNIHKITRNQSRALTTTALTSVYAQADHAVYQANEKALEGWQYVAVLDSATTPICSHRDGSIYEIGDTQYLPPAHYRCRSITTPVFKSWDSLQKLEGVAQVRQRNLKGLTKKQRGYYDGLTPLRVPYDVWLRRQTSAVQLRHLGSQERLELFRTKQLTVDKFTNPEGKSVGLRTLRKLTSSEYVPVGGTVRFATAKNKLDALRLGISRPEDLYDDQMLLNNLATYYKLQSTELDGLLSLTNYRGVLVGNKRRTKAAVLNRPPTDDKMVFNPVTGRYDDPRRYQPMPLVHTNALKRVEASESLSAADKGVIHALDKKLEDTMSINERAVVVDNLRILFTRYRKNGEVWQNFKAVSVSQMKFDVMNISDSLETALRADSGLLKRLSQDNYLDPVLGAVQLQELHDNFISNIKAKNTWEDKTAPKIARELRNVFDYRIPLKLHSRMTNQDLEQFYLRFAHRLSMADMPDRDQFAVALGRDLHEMANYNGDRLSWYKAGMRVLEAENVEKFFKVETFGTQKRRMKSRMSNQYFGAYYDTTSWNIRVTDPRVQRYAKLTRAVEVGLRVGVTTPGNRLKFKTGYKTYFVNDGLKGDYDTRIPITSTSAFSDFPEDLVDRDLVDALNWASKAEYKVDEDFYDFVDKLMHFKDDRGRASFYDDLNGYRKYLTSRGDAYERFKAMEWLRKKDAAFSNQPFIDHRARVYDRGLIGPQSGETFRPFLNTAKSQNFSAAEFLNLQDQVGAFLGGLTDFFEGRFDSLTITGRQKIANKWRPELIAIGRKMRRGKPSDIRAILESPIVAQVDPEELGKFFRFAIELTKIDDHLEGLYTKRSLETLSNYKISLALEQDASSSGAQIIALTTKNKQLAELSNVVPTTQKRRLYDEVARETFNDPRFRQLNEKLGLTERDLRKASKAQNMVSFYGAGERTGILNVEAKLGKILGREEGTLVVRAAERDEVLNEISAQAAKIARFDKEGEALLRALRKDVRDTFNKGTSPGLDMMEDLWFLTPETKGLLERMSKSYNRVITPDDFRQIAKIMSEHLSIQVPILKDFTKYFGRLAEDFLKNAKPSDSAFGWKSIFKLSFYGEAGKGQKIPDSVASLFGIEKGTLITEEFMKRYSPYGKDSSLYDMLLGARPPEARRTGVKFLRYKLLGQTLSDGIEFMTANKLPKRWTNVPWVNFDGKVIEQNFTQSFEEKLSYIDKNGNRVNNILQIPQKSQATWWEQFINDSGNINDVADATKARTAYGVNGNHSNDAVIVKRFHLWGKSADVQTSTIHDAFFANAAEMLNARQALRQIYSNLVDRNVIKQTLDEMLARGLPRHLYDQYLNEAIDIGLIPVVGRSRVGGRLLKDTDVLGAEEILKELKSDFSSDLGWYGVG